ncbi:type IV pilin protein [Kangiella sp. TOML190]|uniref:type IV pilin protein n=1 Tax=Kangiella sp. TOML190 TaxID=2931351 RepID=UPI00203A84C1|nr:type IV pilin protein [Kangiella sp. TOML190]
MKKYKAGFTLVEVLIVVVVVAILAAIAIPSYQNYVIRTKRGDAMAALMSAVQAAERYKANNNFSYQGLTNADIPSQVPVEGGAAYYNIGVDNVTATTYTLTATPTGSQPASDGSLTINQSGAKNWTKTNNGCWPESGSTC